MEKYRILGKKGEGTFSEVLKCQNVRDATFWAAKKMKQLYKNMDEIQQIREIRVLKQLNGHPNIVFLREIIFDKRTGVLCLIFELMNYNLYEYIRGRQKLLPSDTICKFMYQLLKALEFVHRHGYFHRDVKPENILIKDDVLKLADFGSCRQISAKQPFTEYISTRWYRAPECLLTDGYYRSQMDIWSAGCVMFEIITLRPLFPGSNEIDQINKIHEILGTPSASLLEKYQHRNSAVDFKFPPRRGTGIARYLSHCSSDTIDLINQLCVYDADHRISASQALRHPYFEVIRTEDQQHIQETNGNSLHTEVRVTRTSEDYYVRPDSASSENSSSDVLITSPRSNIYHTSTEQQQTVESEFNKVVHSPTKAQSLIETRNENFSKKQSHFKTKSQPKVRPPNRASYYHLQQNQVHYPNDSVVSQHSPTNVQSTKNGPIPFLPRISGASAFSNYSNNTKSSSITKQSNYPGKSIVNYYPIVSYRTYKK